MSTVEKLFVQIFERNNQIKQQVKHQTELYLQNLASKFLLNGIDPPPWLWNPNQSSSDAPKELNKEELISELFLPRPQHPVAFYGSRFCPYNQSVTYETAELLDRSSKAVEECSNSDSGARQACAAVAFDEDNAGCGTKDVPEAEVSITSPKDETEIRISNVIAAQEQSLVRIQRSKSRQKALELRESSKAKRKNLSQEGILAVSSAEDRLPFGRNEVDLVNGMEDLGKPYFISHESCDNENLNEGDSREKETERVFAASHHRSSSNFAAGNGLKPDCLDYIPQKDCTEEIYNREISSFHSKYNEHMEDYCTSNADYSKVPVQSSMPTLKHGEPHVGSLESDLEVSFVDLKDHIISPINYSTLKISPDYSQVHIQSATHKADNGFNAFNISGTENYMSISLKDGSKCIPELDIAKQQKVEGKEKYAYVPLGIEVDHSENDYCASKDNLDMIESVGDDRHLDPLKSCEIQVSEKLQSLKRYSWPSNKRRKLEKEETGSSFSSSPGFKIQIEPWSFKNSDINVQGESKAVVGQSTVADSCDDEQIYQTLSCQLTKSIEDSLEFRKNERRSHSVVLSEHENISFSPNLNQGEEYVLITSATEIDGVPQGSLLSELDLADGSFQVMRNQKSDHEDEALVNTEANIDVERSIDNGSPFVFDSRLAGKLAESPAKWDLDMIGADQPVLEGFITDPETLNGHVGTPRNEITFDGLELPKTSVECSSIMEKFCKSASMQTPQILSIYKPQGMHSCHRSVPNGLIECTDMNRFSASNGQVYGHSRTKVDGTKESFQETYSDYLPYSESRYSCDLQSPFTSPLGNLWDKFSSHCECSGKRLSSNPEFACFPIEEDPDSGDENEDISVPESVSKKADTVVYTCSKRKPLDNLLIGEKEKKSFNDSTNKINSYGTSSRTKQHTLSVKDPKQKKDAASCKGKRDIKVKALEDAKVTKQQQEKRDQERKLRKEIRLVELNKKKKEEERMKKDAEITAKKRAREEAERKEMGNKRKRMEETRKQCLHEGKSVFDRVNKGKQLYIPVTPTMAKPVEMNKMKQNIIDISYEISPYQGSDVEEDSEDELSDEKAFPFWAWKSCAALAVRSQHEIDPSEIFPADSFCCTSEVMIPWRQQSKDTSGHQ